MIKTILSWFQPEDIGIRMELERKLADKETSLNIFTGMFNNETIRHNETRSRLADAEDRIVDLERKERINQEIILVQETQIESQKKLLDFYKEVFQSSSPSEDKQ